MGLADTCDIDTSGTGATVTQSDERQKDNDDISPVTVSGATVTANAYGSESITVTVPDDASTADDDESETRVYTFTVNKVVVSKVAFGVLDLGSDNALGGTGEAADKFIEDNDNVFGAGTDIDVQVTVSYSQGDAPLVTLSAPTTGVSLEQRDTTGVPAAGTTQRLASIAVHATRDVNEATTDTADRLVTVTVQGAHTILTDGAPDGLYEVTATAANGTVVSSKKTSEFRISDAGNAVGGASLQLGLSEGYGNPDASKHKRESGQDGNTGSINLELSVENGIGNPANASDVDEIRVIAPFGTVKYSSAGTDDPFMDPEEDNTIPGTALTKGRVIIEVGSSGNVSRKIDVYAIVLGSRAGVATTETVPLTFTGDASSVGISDASETLRALNIDGPDAGTDLDTDSVDLVVTATDKADNPVGPGTLGWTLIVTDPEGVVKDADTVGRTGPVWDTKQKRWEIRISNVGGNDPTSALKTGEWTLTASKGTIKASAKFTVVGKADTVGLMVGERGGDVVGH